MEEKEKIVKEKEREDIGKNLQEFCQTIYIGHCTLPSKQP
jgi:hypothetical protein